MQGRTARGGSELGLRCPFSSLPPVGFCTQEQSGVTSRSHRARTASYQCEVRVHLWSGTKSQNHRFRLKYQSTPTIEESMSALAYHTPCGLLLQGRCRFMPKKPVITTSGNASVP